MAKKTEKTKPKPAKKPRPESKALAAVSEKVKSEIVNLPIQEKEILEWLNITGMVKKLHDDEKLHFLKIAKAYNLNPFKREIFCNVYSPDSPTDRTIAILIGYNVFLKRAERIKILDGWGCVTVGEIPNMKARLTIYRKDRKFPFTYEVEYKEVVQTKSGGTPNHFWSKMPKFMTKKVCISQGFRICFPDEFEDHLYTDAEAWEDQKYEDMENRTPTGTDDLKIVNKTSENYQVEPEPAKKDNPKNAAYLFQSIKDLVNDPVKQKILLSKLVNIAGFLKRGNEAVKNNNTDELEKIILEIGGNL